MFVYNGKLKEIPTREKVIESVDLVFMRLEQAEQRASQYKLELDRPVDERLAEANKKIAELENSLARAYSFDGLEAQEVHFETGCRSANWHYKIVPTGIGTVIEFKCDTCGFCYEIQGL